jgi:hypothetical protein
MIVTCHTQGCSNAGAPIDLTELFAAPDPPEIVVCGVCGQAISDLIDPAELAPTDPDGSQDPADDGTPDE